MKTYYLLIGILLMFAPNDSVKTVGLVLFIFGLAFIPARKLKEDD
jgi:hypothetical protein